MALTFKSSIAAPAELLVSNYAYAGLDEATVSRIKGAVTRIRNNLANATQSVIEVGYDLIDVKERLSHGEFGTWIDAEFGMSMRTAQNFMSAVRMIGSFGMAPEIVQAIPQKLLYQLASPKVPGEIVIDVIEQIEQGKKPDVLAVLAKIKATKITPAEKPAAEIETNVAATMVAVLKEHLTPAALDVFRSAMKKITADELRDALFAGAAK